MKIDNIIDNMNKNKIKITLLKSFINSPKKIKDTLHTLGLKKINSQVEHISHPQILGMISKVQHLIRINK